MWAAMEERRIYLQLRIEDVARQAGVSPNTLRSVGSGRPTRPLTDAGIERALKWERGSLDRLRAGQKPTLVGGGNPPFSLADQAEWDIWSETDLSPKQRSGAIQQRRERIRQTGQ